MYEKIYFKQIAWRCIFLFCLSVTAVFTGTKVGAYEQTGNYLKTNVSGWNVYFSSHFDQKPRDRSRILGKLNTQMAFLASVLSEQHLKTLYKADFWVESGDHYRVLGRYFGSKGMIYQEELNPQKLKDVEIFGSFARKPYPSLVLHELAHVYHDRKLRRKDHKIERMYDAFEAAMPGAKDRCGKVTKAYALKNHHEFFASFTEAFFYKTCGYPYDRRTIQERHPDMYAFLVETWGAEAASR